MQTNFRDAFCWFPFIFFFWLTVEWEFDWLHKLSEMLVQKGRKCPTQMQKLQQIPLFYKQVYICRIVRDVLQERTKEYEWPALLRAEKRRVGRVRWGDVALHAGDMESTNVVCA